MSVPQVSIIIATYNCSHLLKHAIESVLDSDFQQWELIVIGDCCTDDSELVVASYSDPRICFLNLEKNSGQQAKPNNYGLELARGAYIAFLNQDDMFFPDHLSRSIKELESLDAEFLIVPGIKIINSNKKDFETGQYQVELCSVHPDGKFSTNVFSVASTWFLKKEVATKLGPWRMEKDLYVTPSQEWIFRGYLAGIRFAFPRRIGSLIILSGERKKSYLQKSSFEHEFFSKRLRNDELKADLLEKASIHAYKELQSQLFFQPKILFKRVFGLPLDWIMKKLKIHPTALRNRNYWGEKGNLIKTIRRDTGLE